MTELVLPIQNANDTGARLVQWVVKPGSQVEEGQLVAVFETTKVSVEIDAPASGWLQSDIEVGEFVEVGQRFGSVSAESVFAAAVTKTVTRKITAKARSLMDKHGVSESSLPDGLEVVRERDVVALVEPLVKAVAEDFDTVLSSQSYVDAKNLLAALRRRMKGKFDRHVPTGTLLHDRWDLAKAWDFGKGASIYDECLIFGDVQVGENCWVGPFTIIDGSAGTLEIGDWTSIGAGSHLYTHHTIDVAMTGGAGKPFRAPTKIGRNCFIAPMVMVAPGTVIGDHCFVAAHSYVEGHFSAYSYIAGNPATVVGKIEIKDGKVVKTLNK